MWNSQIGRTKCKMCRLALAEPRLQQHQVGARSSGFSILSMWPFRLHRYHLDFTEAESRTLHETLRTRKKKKKITPTCLLCGLDTKRDGGVSELLLGPPSLSDHSRVFLCYWDAAVFDKEAARVGRWVGTYKEKRVEVEVPLLKIERHFAQVHWSRWTHSLFISTPCLFHFIKMFIQGALCLLLQLSRDSLPVRLLAELSSGWVSWVPWHCLVE